MEGQEAAVEEQVEVAEEQVLEVHYHPCLDRPKVLERLQWMAWVGQEVESHQWELFRHPHPCSTHPARGL